MRQIVKCEAYQDDQDPANVGWAWRVTYGDDGSQDSGPADDLHDAVSQCAACGPEGMVPLLVGEWTYRQELDCWTVRPRATV